MGHKGLVAKNKFDVNKGADNFPRQGILNSKILITVLAAFNFG